MTHNQRTMLAAVVAAAFVIGPAHAQEPPQTPGYATVGTPNVNPTGSAPQGYPGLTPTYPGGGGSPFPPPASPPGGPYGPPGYVPPEVKAQQARYGLNPAVGKFFGTFGSHGCSACCKKPKQPPVPVPPPVIAKGGTLVYPHHPYVRGPRDFFMYGERGPAFGE